MLTILIVPDAQRPFLTDDGPHAAVGSLLDRHLQVKIDVKPVVTEVIRGSGGQMARRGFVPRTTVVRAVTPYPAAGLPDNAATPAAAVVSGFSMSHNCSVSSSSMGSLKIVPDSDRRFNGDEAGCFPIDCGRESPASRFDRPAPSTGLRPRPLFGQDTGLSRRTALT